MPMNPLAHFRLPAASALPLTRWAQRERFCRRDACRPDPGKLRLGDATVSRCRYCAREMVRVDGRWL